MLGIKLSGPVPLLGRVRRDDEPPRVARRGIYLGQDVVLLVHVAPFPDGLPPGGLKGDSELHLGTFPGR